MIPWTLLKKRNGSQPWISRLCTGCNILNWMRFMTVQCYAIWNLQHISNITAINGVCIAGFDLGVLPCLLGWFDRSWTHRTEHFYNLRKVLDRFWKANLKLNPKKIKFFKKEVQYLNHIVLEMGVSIDLEKLKVVPDRQTPKNNHNIKSFLGLCAYYRQFIEGFSVIEKPLISLTDKRKPFALGRDETESFSQLKSNLCSALIFGYPRLND